MTFVVMRLNLSSALTNDNGIMAWNDFEKAQKAAVNFGGIAVEIGEAYRIMSKMKEEKT